MRSLFLSLLLSTVFVLPAGAAVDTSKLQLPGDITLEQARTVVEGALEFAKKQGVPMNITVVDAGGNLKAFCRMDGAFLGSIDISQKKAVTARRFNMSSAELGALAQPGKELFGIEATNGGWPFRRRRALKRQERRHHWRHWRQRWFSSGRHQRREGRRSSAWKVILFISHTDGRAQSPAVRFCLCQG